MHQGKFLHFLKYRFDDKNHHEIPKLLEEKDEILSERSDYSRSNNW